MAGYGPEQVKLISFIWEGVDFTLGIIDVPLNLEILSQDLKGGEAHYTR